MNEQQATEWAEQLTAERKQREEAERERRGYAHQFAVGDGATLRIGTDAQAYTVTAVSASGQTITMRQDKATLDPAWRPRFVPGGFVGHVTNNYEQRWDYQPDLAGVTRKARLTKRGWRSNGTPVTTGRHQFHDYNF
jgi:hypothetical protein